MQSQSEFKKTKIFDEISAKSCMMARHKEDLPSHETISARAKTITVAMLRQSWMQVSVPMTEPFDIVFRLLVSLKGKF